MVWHGLGVVEGQCGVSGEGYGTVIVSDHGKEIN